MDGPSQGGGRIKYTIESDNSISNNGNIFIIDRDTGEITILNKVNSMDTPRGQYELLVRATDYGLYYMVIYYITIYKENITYFKGYSHYANSSV